MRTISTLLIAFCAVACSPSPAPVPAAQPAPAAPPVAIPVAQVLAPQLPDGRPPRCFDKETLATVRNIVRSQFLPGDAYKAIPEAVFNERVDVSDAAPERWDADIGRWHCSAKLVVDSSVGLDKLGQAIVNSPQMLHNAGSSVAELERLIISDLSSDRKRFTYAIQFASQNVGEGGKFRVSMANISDLRAFMTGSFISAHIEAKNAAGAPGREAEAAKATAPAEAASR